MKTALPIITAALLALATPLCAQVPSLLNYQGRVAVAGVNFDGTGQFKFALVNAAGTTSYWSNDGTSNAGSQPAGFVSLNVTNGLYAVLLGDTAVPNMTAMPAGVFDNAEVRLRVWFNDGTNGFHQITPDQRLAAAPWALHAAKADTVPDGSITAAKLAPGAVSDLLLSNILAPPVQPVVAWGSDLQGQSSAPALANVAAVAAGSTQSLALLDNGTVTAWGNGPAVPGTAVTVTHIAAGASHFLACKTDGTILAWGDNSFGQTTVPGGITTAANVAAGEKHSLILKADGTLVAFGSNTFGQLTIPGAATGITAIACGYDHSLALKGDGTVIAWGRNDAGQSSVPGGLSGVVAIGAGSYHSLAVKNDGTVVAWGWDLGGQATVPAGLSGVSKVAGGYAFSLALKADGTLIAWGDGSEGQTTIPVSATSITHLAAGATHALALRADLIPAQVARLDQDNIFTGSLGIRRAPAANSLEVEGQVSKSTAGNWAANSDRRIKTDIAPVTGAMESIRRVNPVTFRYTPEYLAAHPAIPDVPYYNVIAQEFRAVYPDAVKGSGERLPDGSEILQVDTYPATITALAAIKELDARLKAKDEEVAELKARLAALEQLVKARP